MTIYLNHLGKRYRDHWVFKDIDYTFEPGETYALLGPNGSGKSTLLRVISGMQSPNKGTIEYTEGNKKTDPEKIFRHISYCAPGLELVEEMSLVEFLKFHFTFKPIIPGNTIGSVIKEMHLENARDKFIHECSSGMKQRIKLAQAFFSDTPILLLDEPCSNLDTEGIALYLEWIRKHSVNRTVLIASNDKREYGHAAHFLFLETYKHGIKQI